MACGFASLVWGRGLDLDIQSSQSHQTHYIHLWSKSGHSFHSAGYQAQPGWLVQDLQTSKKNWQVTNIRAVSEITCFDLTVTCISRLRPMAGTKQLIPVGPVTWLKHLFAHGDISQFQLSEDGRDFLHQRLRIMVLELENEYRLKIFFEGEADLDEEHSARDKSFSSFDEWVQWLNDADDAELEAVSSERIRVTRFGEPSCCFKSCRNRNVTGITLLSAVTSNAKDGAEAGHSFEPKGTDCQHFLLKVISGHISEHITLSAGKTGEKMRYIAAALHSSGYLGNGFSSTLDSETFRGANVSAAGADTTITGFVKSGIKQACRLPSVGQFVREKLGEGEKPREDEVLQGRYQYYKSRLGDGARYVFSSSWFDVEKEPEEAYELKDQYWIGSMCSRLAMKFVQPGGGSWAGKIEYFFPELEDEHKFSFSHVEGIDFSSVAPEISQDTHLHEGGHAGYLCGKTGLRFVVLRDQHHPDELTLAFACAFTSNRKWHFGSVKNLLFNGVQAGSAATTLVHYVPPMFRQAKEVAEIVSSKLTELDASTLTLSGYCLGGTIAQYVAGLTRLPAYCINPFPLGTALQRDLCTVLGEMDDYVFNISVEGDWASNFPYIDPAISLMTWLGFSGRPRIFGTRRYVPAFKDELSCYRRHLLVRSSVLEWARWRMSKEQMQQ
ncbi:hypothetical protein ACWJJH_05715 [Endozoicomonadaceae bacterium StTr2]